MPIAVQIDRPGGPEEMKLVDLPVGQPGPGQVRIRHHAIGLNFIDVYQRTGLYPLPMPLTLGMEGAGVIEAVGEGVTHLKPGDRAAYAGNPPGSYSQVRVMPALTVCRLPDDIGFDTAAAMMLKGLTAQYLLRRTLPAEGLQPGDHILWHAAAGGVGLIACQWAKAMASFGNASGPVPPFAPAVLAAKCLYVTRATLFTHIATRERCQAMADELFAVVRSGQVRIHIDQRFALQDVQAAHRALEARQTTGSTILTL